MSNYSKLLENTNGSLDLTQMEEQATVSGNGSSASGLSLFRKSSASPDLKEPLTSKDLESGSVYEDDPFYVFREDLYRKLDLVDEALQDYLRVVYHTVSRTMHTTLFRIYYISPCTHILLGYLGQYVRAQGCQKTTKTAH